MAHNHKTGFDSHERNHKETIMNKHEWSWFESRDWFCDMCGKLISTDEFIDNYGLCNECVEKSAVVADKALADDCLEAEGE